MNRLAGAMHGLLQRHKQFRDDMQQFMAQHPPEVIAELIDNQRKLTEEVDHIMAYLFGNKPRK